MTCQAFTIQPKVAGSEMFGSKLVEMNRGCNFILWHVHKILYIIYQNRIVYYINLLLYEMYFFILFFQY